MFYYLPLLLLIFSCGTKSTIPKKGSNLPAVELSPPSSTNTPSNSSSDSDGNSSTVTCSNISGERRFATKVVQANGASGKGFGNTLLAANGVFGGGDKQGSLDVFSLNEAEDKTLILSWDEDTVCNESGSDIVVFENAFYTDDAKNFSYIEPAIVSVSYDGKNYADFSRKYLGIEKNGKKDILKSPGSKLKADWIGFAGLSTVLYHEKNNGLKNCVDPFDSDRAGGDHFDLDELEDTDVAREIKKTGFKFIKIEAPMVRENPETCQNGKCKKYPFADYADIDGVYAKCFQKNF